MKNNQQRNHEFNKKLGKAISISKKLFLGVFLFALIFAIAIFKPDLSKVVQGLEFEVDESTANQDLDFSSMADLDVNVTNLAYKASFTSTTEYPFQVSYDDFINGNTYFKITSSQGVINLGYLSMWYNFNGKTIYLASDIDMSTGTNWDFSIDHTFYKGARSPIKVGSSYYNTAESFEENVGYSSSPSTLSVAEVRVKSTYIPIGYYKDFRGTFNGLGHKISGLQMNQAATTVKNATGMGLFSGTYHATICNFTAAGSANSDGLWGLVVSLPYFSLVYNVVNEINYNGNGGVAGIGFFHITNGQVRYKPLNPDAMFLPGFTGTYINCVNKGNLLSTSGNGVYSITGDGCGITLINCVNYGNLKATGWTSIFSVMVRDHANFLNLINYGGFADSYADYALLSHTPQYYTDGYNSSLIENVYSTAVSNVPFFRSWRVYPNHTVSTHSDSGTEAVARKVGLLAGDLKLIDTPSTKFDYDKENFKETLNKNIQNLRTRFPEYASIIADFTYDATDPDCAKGPKLQMFDVPEITYKPIAYSETILFSYDDPGAEDVKDTFYFKTTGQVKVENTASLQPIWYSIDGGFTYQTAKSGVIFKSTVDKTILLKPSSTAEEKYIRTISLKKSLTVTSVSDIRTLNEFAINVNFGNSYQGGTVNLTNDIDLQNDLANNYIVIGDKNINPFKGTFNGNGHVINNIHNNTISQGGLFGFLNGAVIKNLTIKGSMAGRGNGASSVSYDAMSTYFINVHSNVDISALSNVSPFGILRGTLELRSYLIHCSNTSPILATGSTAAGIAASASFATFINVHNNALITAGADTSSGIVGIAENIVFENVVSTGGNAGAPLLSGLIGIMIYNNDANLNFNSFKNIYFPNNYPVSGYRQINGTKISNATTASATDFTAFYNNFQARNGNTPMPKGPGAGHSVTKEETISLNDYVAELRYAFSNRTLDFKSKVTKSDIGWWDASNTSTAQTTHETLRLTQNEFPLLFTSRVTTSPLITFFETNGHYLQEVNTIYFLDQVQVNALLNPESSSDYAVREKYFYKIQFQISENGDWLDYNETIVISSDTSYLKFKLLNVFGEVAYSTVYNFVLRLEVPSAPDVLTVSNEGSILSSLPEEPNINKTYYSKDVYVVSATEDPSTLDDKIAFSHYEYSLTATYQLWSPFTSKIGGSNYEYFNFSTSGHTDRTYTVYVVAVNIWGVRGLQTAVTFTLDTKVPSVPEYSADYITTWARNQATFTFLAESSVISEDGYHFEYAVIKSTDDVESFIPLTYSESFSNKLTLTASDSGDGIENAFVTKIQGMVQLRVRTVSRSGVPSVPLEIMVLIDGAAPTVNITSSNTLPLAENIVLTSHAVDRFGIGGIVYGWIKFPSSEITSSTDFDIRNEIENYISTYIESGQNPWNNQSTQIVDYNDYYYVSLVKDALDFQNFAYYLVTNYSPTRPTNPSITVQYILISQTPTIESSWVPFKGTETEYLTRSAINPANNNALIPVILHESSTPGGLEDTVGSNNRYFYKWVSNDTWISGLSRLEINHGEMYLNSIYEIKYTSIKIENNEPLEFDYVSPASIYYYIPENYGGILKVYGVTVDESLKSSSIVAGGFSFITEIKIDKTAPSYPNVSVLGENVSLLSVNHYITNSNLFTISSSAVNEIIGSGINRIEYKLDNGSWVTYTEPIGISEELSLIHTIKFRQVDNAANISDELVIYITIDLDKPTYTLSLEETNIFENTLYSNDSFNIYITPDDITSFIKKVEYSYNGGNTWNQILDVTLGVFTLNISESGELFLRITDASLNYSDSYLSVVYEIAIIHGKPTSTVSYETGYVNTETKEVTFLVNPNLLAQYGVTNDKYYFSNESNPSIDWDSAPQITDNTFTEYLEEGTYYFFIHDSLLNVSDVIVVVIDKIITDVPVILGIEKEVTGLTNNDRILYPYLSSPTITETLYYISYDSSTPTGSETGWDLYVTVPNNGEYYIFAKDVASNISLAFEYTESEIDKIAPVVLVVSWEIGIVRIELSDVGSDVLGYSFTTTPQFSDATIQYVTEYQYVTESNKYEVAIYITGEIYLWAIDKAFNHNSNLVSAVIEEPSDSGTFATTFGEVTETTPESEVVQFRSFSVDVTDGDGLRSYAVTTSSSAPLLDDPVWQVFTKSGINIIGVKGTVTIDFDVYFSNTTVYLWIVDVSHDPTPTSINFHVGVIDNEAPVINISEVTQPYEDYIKAYLELTTEEDNLYYKINNGSWILVEYAGTIYIPLEIENQFITFSLKDSASNVSTETLTTSLVDKTNPIVVLTVISELEWVNTDKVVNLSTTDFSNLEYILYKDSVNISNVVDSGTIDSGIQVLTSLNLDNGYYILVLVDEYGNRTERIFVISRIDKVLPNITTNYVSEEALKSVTLVVTVLNVVLNEVYQYSIDGSLYQSSNVFYLTLNGTYTVYVKNLANVISDIEITVDNIDRTTPSLSTVVVEDAQVWTNTYKNIIFTISDSNPLLGDKYNLRYYLVSSSSVTPSAFSDNWVLEGVPLMLAEGTYYLFARDEANNISSYKFFTVSYYDTVNPIGIVTSRVLDSSTEMLVSFNLNDTNGSGVKGYYISTNPSNPGEFHAWTDSELVLNLTIGTYYLVFEDYATNKSEKIQITVNPALLTTLLNIITLIPEEIEYDASTLYNINDALAHLSSYIAFIGDEFTAISDLGTLSYDKLTHSNLVYLAIEDLYNGYTSGAIVYHGYVYYSNLRNENSIGLLNEYYNNAILLIREATTSERMHTIVVEALFAMSSLPIEYTITYVYNGGEPNSELDEPKTYYLSSDPTYVLLIPIKTGYTFIGWYTEDTFDNSRTNIRTGTAENLTLYARFELTVFTITYILNGGTNSPSNPLTYTYETETIYLANAIGEVLDFEGWFTDPGFNSSFKITEITSGSLTNYVLYAKWDTGVYTVYFDYNGGVGSLPSKQVTKGDVYGVLPQPTKPGYTFGGWFVNSDFSGDEIVAYSLVSNTVYDTLYAKWIASSFTVILNVNGGDSLDTVNFEFVFGTQISGLPVPVRTHYTFLGWFSLTNEEYKNSDTFNTPSSLTLFAKWEITNYLINYHLYDGSNNSYNPLTYTYFSSEITLLDPVKNGYDFVGWFTDNLFTTQIFSIGINSENNIDLYAKWELTLYTITYLETFDSPNSNEVTFTILSSFTFSELVREGYDFTGWYDSYNTTIILGVTPNTFRNLILFATWEAHTFEVSLEAGEGEISSNTVTATYGLPISNLPIPSVTDRYFIGWFDDLSNQYTNATLYLHDEAITLHAMYSLYPTITFLTNGGSSVPTISQEIGSSLDEPIPTRVGYEFAGWYESPIFEDDSFDFTGGMPSLSTVLYANWVGITYYVRYNSNSGTGTIEDDIFTYDNFTNSLSSNIFTKVGYHFVGWSLSENGSVAFANNATIHSNLTSTKDAVVELFALWAANNYTVKFYKLDGSSDFIVEEFTYDQYKNLRLNSFTNTGYKFGGWSLSYGGEVTYTDGANVLNLTSTQNFEFKLYAKWNPITYSIVFDANTGFGTMDSQVITFSNTQTTLNSNNFEKTGYSFIGWGLSNNMSVNYTDTDAIYKNLVTVDGGVLLLYACWSANSYTVIFDGNGSSNSMENELFTYDVAQNLTLSSLNRDGYIFSGWVGNYINYIDNELVTNLVPSGSITLTAVWTPIAVNVLFNYNGTDITNSSISFIVVSYGSYYGTLPEPLRTGYTFGGWYLDDSSFIDVITESSTVSLLSSTYLFAKWIANEFVITYVVNGGSSIALTTTVVYDALYGDLEETTRTGYTFAGWYLDSLLTELITSSSTVSIVKSQNVYAKWTPLQYLITFDPNGGILSELTKSVLYGKEVGTLGSPIKANSFFAGWFDILSNEYTSQTIYLVDGPLTLYAHYNNFPTLSFNSIGGSQVNSISLNSGETLPDILLYTPTKVGYTFVGWYYEDQLKNAFVWNTMPDVSKTLYAKYQANLYTVTYLSNSSEIGTKNVYFDDAFGGLIVPTRTGYTFAGWYLEDNFETLVTSSTIYKNTTNIDIYAKWVANTYTINFNPNGGVGNIPLVSFTYDVSKNLPINTFSKTGYHFVGWARSSNGALQYEDNASILNALTSGSFTLYALWEANTYTIVFNANGADNTMESEIIYYDSPTSLTANSFNKVGYHFVGWSRTSNGVVAFHDSEIIFNLTTINSESIDLYAIYEANNYSISFVPNGGTGVMSNQSHVYDSEKALSTNLFTLVGYHFVGWTLDSLGLDGLYLDRELITNLSSSNGSVVYLYAKWEITNYNIYYDLDNGTNHPGNPLTYTYESSRIQLNTPTKTGYRFISWYGDSEFLDTKNVIFAHSIGDIYVYAKWELVVYQITYVLNGGTNNPENPASYRIVDPNITLQNPTRFGYTFAGWYLEEGFSNLSSTISVYDAADVTRYAKWTLIPAPGVVTLLTATQDGSSNNIDYSWSAPIVNADSIIGYEICFSPLQTVWISNGLSTTYRSEGLAFGVEVYFAVRAITSNTKGAISSIYKTPVGSATRPGEVSVGVEIIGGDVKFTFTVSNTNGAVILGYYYGFKSTSGVPETLIYITSPLNYVLVPIDSLPISGDSYYIYVYADSSAGDGDETNIVLGAPKAYIPFVFEVESGIYNPEKTILDLININISFGLEVVVVYEIYFEGNWVIVESDAYLPGKYRVSISREQDETYQEIPLTTKEFSITKQNIDEYDFLNQTSEIYDPLRTGIEANITNVYGVVFDILYSKINGSFSSTLPVDAGIYYVEISINEAYRNTYNFATVVTTFEINKLEVNTNTLSLPELSPITYSKGTRLFDIILSTPSIIYGEFVWVNPNENPVVNKSYYLVRFQLNDTTNYKVVGEPREIEQIVNIKVYEFTFETFDSLFEGENLPSLSLYLTENTEVKGNFTWKGSSVAIKNVTDYVYVWTPINSSDRSNYATVEGHIYLSAAIPISLEQIFITSSPVTVYNAFDTIDLTGLKMYARYNFGPDKLLEITSANTSYQGSDLFFNASDSYFRITYSDKGTELTINVNITVNQITLEVNATRVDDSILYTSTAIDSILLEDENISEFGSLSFVQVALFAGTRYYDYQFHPYDPVNYKVITKSISLTVLAVEATGLTLDTDTSSYNLNYVAFDKFDFDKVGLVIVLHYNDSTTFTLPASYIEIRYQNNASEILGNHDHVIAHYRDFDVNVPITVSLKEPNVNDFSLGVIYFENGMLLGEVSISSSYTWKYPDTLINLGSSNVYTAIYHPEDSINYNVKEVLVSFVAKQNISDYIFVNSNTSVYNGSSIEAIITNSFGVSFKLSYSVDQIVYSNIAPINAGNYSVKVELDISDTNLYIFETVILQFTINKLDVTSLISEPSISDSREYSEALILLNIPIPGNVYGTFAWSNPSEHPTVQNQNFKVNFTLSDNLNYKVVDGGISFNIRANITKKHLDFTFMNFPTFYEGDVLPDLRDYVNEKNLPSGVFTYDNDLVYVLKGTFNYTVTYTPNDLENYMVGNAIVRITGLEDTLIEINLVSDPTTTNYLAFEEFDFTGIVIKAKYNHKADIEMNPSDFIVSYQHSIDSFSGNDNYVTLIYKENLSLQIIVHVTVSRIDLVLDPIYSPDVLYSTSLVSIITLNDPNNLVPGTYSLIASVLSAGDHPYAYTFIPLDLDNYNVYNGTIVISVREVVATLLTVSSTSTHKQIYSSFDTFDKTGLVMQVQNNDSYVVTIPVSYISVVYQTSNSYLTGDDTYVTICYLDLKYELSVQVNKLVPNVSDFSIGNVKYTPGLLLGSVNLPTGYEFEFKDTEIFIGLNEHTAIYTDSDIVNYTTKIVKVTFTVSLLVVTDVSIISGPSILNYFAFDQIDLTGLVIRVSFDDGDPVDLRDGNGISVSYQSGNSYFLYGDIYATLTLDMANNLVIPNIRVVVNKIDFDHKPVLVSPSTIKTSNDPGTVILEDEETSLYGSYKLLTKSFVAGELLYEYKFTPYDLANYEVSYGEILLNVLNDSKELDDSLNTNFSVSQTESGEHIIPNITSGTLVSEILNDIEVAGSVVITNNLGDIVSNTDNILLGTGFRVSLYDEEGVLLQTAVVIIDGDIDGDGLVDIVDVEKMFNSLTSDEVLNEFQLEAADYTKDHVFSMNDIAAILAVMYAGAAPLNKSNYQNMSLVGENQVSYQVNSSKSKEYIKAGKAIDFEINIINNSFSIVAFDFTIMFDSNVFKFEDNYIKSPFVKNLSISSNSRSIQVRGYLDRIVELSDFNLFVASLVLVDNPVLGNSEVKLIDTSLYDTKSANNECFVTTIFFTIELSTFFTDVYKNLPYIFLVIVIIAISAIMVLMFISRKHAIRALSLEKEKVVLEEEKVLIEVKNTQLSEELVLVQELHRKELEKLAIENEHLEEDALKFEREKEEFATNMALAGSDAVKYYRETENLLVEKGRIQAELADINKDQIGINKKIANNPDLSSDEIGRLNIILDNLAKKDIVTKESLNELNRKLSLVRVSLIKSNEEKGKNSPLPKESPLDAINLIEEVELSDNSSIPGYFKVIKKESGFHFELYSSSDVLLITSVYGYKASEGVLSGINNFKKTLLSALIEVIFVNVDGIKKYRLLIKSKNALSSKFSYEGPIYETVEEVKINASNLIGISKEASIIPYTEK
ncbi:MAG: InlB B-repeat-containing protein [Acholeplasmatales bacterium]|jgi:uncharacterized repeat protein (TIGR02543 family)|nr:InlB B-repeat-containing protein [Acholeplasmatales bacterium]